LDEKLKDLEKGREGLRWATLIGKCLEQRFRQHGYKICYYRTAKQDSVSLGSFEGWDNSGHSAVMLFENGQRCQAGPPRSLRLRFTCGPREELLDLSEPSWCAHEAQVSHPSACGPEDLRQAEAEAAGAALHPHEEL